MTNKKVIIKLECKDGTEHKIKVPSNIKVKDLIIQIKNGLNLPTLDEEFLIKKTDRKKLNDDKTLNEEGILNGNTLILLQKGKQIIIIKNMDENIIVKCELNDGTEHKIKAPSNMKVKDFVSHIKKGLKLSDFDHEYLLKKADREKLIDDKTLIEEGISNGNTLILIQEKKQIIKHKRTSKMFIVIPLAVLLPCAIFFGIKYWPTETLVLDDAGTTQNEKDIYKEELSKREELETMPEDFVKEEFVPTKQEVLPTIMEESIVEDKVDIDMESERFLEKHDQEIEDQDIPQKRIEEEQITAKEDSEIEEKEEKQTSASHEQVAKDDVPSESDIEGQAVSQEITKEDKDDGNKGSIIEDQEIHQKEVEEKQIIAEENIIEEEEEQTSVSQDKVAKVDASNGSDIEAQAASQETIEEDQKKAKIEESEVSSHVDERPYTSNQPPIIRAININHIQPIQQGKRIEVKVDAFDSDSDTLIYSWKTDRSYFLSDNTIKPTNYLSAPFEKGDFTITVSVNDQRGGYCQKEEKITVMNPILGNNLGDYSVLRVFKNNIETNINLCVLDVDFDSENNMYVLDPAGRCIRVYDSNRRYTKTLCRGEFETPNKLLIEKDKLYVIFNNKFVNRYNLNGKLELNYNETRPNQHATDILRKPVAMAIGSSGELYVIDGDRSNIAIFEKDGRFRRRFGNNEIRTLINPVAINVDRGGNIYVLDSDKGGIVVYDSNLQNQRSNKLKRGKFIDMFYDKSKGLFYLINAADRNVLVVDAFGNFIAEFGKLLDPYKISMDKFNNIYVTNKFRSYIDKYTHNDNKYKYYGKFGTNPFTSLANIAVGSKGAFFLLNEQSGEIVEIDKDGWELNRFGAKGDRDEKFRKPITFVAGRGGKHIYVLEKYKKQVFEKYKSRVLEFANSGEFIGTVPRHKNDMVTKPIDINSDKEDNVYILDAREDICFVYNFMGEFVSQIGTKSKKKYFKKYQAKKIAVEPQGENAYLLLKKTNPIERDKWKIDKYTKKINKYISISYKNNKVPENASILKVNNYGRLMIADSPKSDTRPHTIKFFNRNGNLEQTLSGKDISGEAGFMKIQDIAVDNVENVYILDENSNVYVFKQEKLMH